MSEENIFTLVPPSEEEDSDGFDLLKAILNHLEDEGKRPKDCIVLFPRYDEGQRIMMFSTMKASKDVKWELDMMSHNLLNKQD